MLGRKDLKFDFSIFDKKINVVDIVYNPENTRFFAGFSWCVLKVKLVGT